MAPSGFQICNLSGNHGVVGLIINTIITMMKELIKMKAEAAATGLPLRSTSHAQLLKLFVREEDEDDDQDLDNHQYENLDNVHEGNDEQCVCVHTSFLEIPLVGT